MLMILDKFNHISNSYGGVKSKASIAFEFALFVKKFVEFTFEYYNIVQTKYNEGRPPH